MGIVYWVVHERVCPWLEPRPLKCSNFPMGESLVAKNKHSMTRKRAKIQQDTLTKKKSNTKKSTFEKCSLKQAIELLRSSSSFKLTSQILKLLSADPEAIRWYDLKTTNNNNNNKTTTKRKMLCMDTNGGRRKQLMGKWQYLPKLGAQETLRIAPWWPLNVVTNFHFLILGEYCLIYDQKKN